MNPYKDHKGLPKPVHHPPGRRRRPVLRWVLLAAAVGLAGWALAGPRPTPTHTPVHPSAFDLDPFTEADWERVVSSLEAVAIAHPDAKERKVAAYMAFLGREGYRLGQLDGAAQALGGIRP